MSKKSLVFIIVFLVAGLSVVHAQDPFGNETQLMAFSQYGFGETLTLTPMAYPTSFGGQLGIGFLNIFFGLGSYVSGHWGDGLLITLLQGGGLVLTVIGLQMAEENASALDLMLGLFNPGFWVTILGVSTYITGVWYGFKAPTKTPRLKTAQLNDPRNWTVAFAPAPNGSVSSVLAFTAHF